MIPTYQDRGDYNLCYFIPLRCNYFLIKLVSQKSLIHLSHHALINLIFTLTLIILAFTPLRRSLTLLLFLFTEAQCIFKNVYCINVVSYKHHSPKKSYKLVKYKKFRFLLIYKHCPFLYIYFSVYKEGSSDKK